MNFAAITSMDENYYNHCGKAMLSSYKKNASHVFPLYLYNEDDFSVKVKTVETLGWNLGWEYESFQKRHTNIQVKRFAKKGFSIIKAMHEIDCDRLIWLDADTIIQQTIPKQLLELISSDDVLSAHFSVWHEKDDIEYHSCETGFFILNKNHTAFQEFRQVYQEIYEQDKTNGLRRFYDGEVYGKTVEILESKGHNMLNLNPGKHKTPISRSILAPYINHYKAGVKDNLTNSELEEKHNL